MGIAATVAMDAAPPTPEGGAGIEQHETLEINLFGQCSLTLLLIFVWCLSHDLVWQRAPITTLTIIFILCDRDLGLS